MQHRALHGDPLREALVADETGPLAGLGDRVAPSARCRVLGQRRRQIGERIAAASPRRRPAASSRLPLCVACLQLVGQLAPRGLPAPPAPA